MLCRCGFCVVPGPYCTEVRWQRAPGTKLHTQWQGQHCQQLTADHNCPRCLRLEMMLLFSSNPPIKTQDNALKKIKVRWGRRLKRMRCYKATAVSYQTIYRTKHKDSIGSIYHNIKVSFLKSLVFFVYRVWSECPFISTGFQMNRGLSSPDTGLPWFSLNIICTKQQSENADDDISLNVENTIDSFKWNHLWLSDKRETKQLRKVPFWVFLNFFNIMR